MVTKVDSSLELDEIIGNTFPVLDYGYVKVVDYMGNDHSIVEAARQSYGNGTKTINDDEKLIRYMFRHFHTSPFEMAEIKLEVKVPMDTWRQWIRHRTASISEYSTRYSIAIDDIYSCCSWRKQSKSNNQGSDENTNFLKEEMNELTKGEKLVRDTCKTEYYKKLDMGVAREQARKDLPLSTYTKAYWKIDLHNLLHFLALRMDEHAQWEIRQYANIIGNSIVSKWVPIVWKAFNDYHPLRGGIIFSKEELKLLRQIIDEDLILTLKSEKNYNLSQREKKEFFEKVTKILSL